MHPLKSLLLALLLALSTGQLVAAAPPPDRTFAVTHAPVTNGQVGVQLFELMGSSSTVSPRQVLSATVPTSAISQIALLSVTSLADPLLVALNAATLEVFVVRPGGQAYPVWKPTYQARALCEFPGDRLMVAGRDNELFTLDSMGADTPWSGAALLDKNLYGEVRALQAVGNDQLVAITDTHLLRISYGYGPQPSIFYAMDLRSKAFGALTISSAHGLAAGAKGAWVHVTAGIPNSVQPRSWEGFAYFDFVAGTNTSLYTPTSGQSMGLQLLDFDPATGDALIRAGIDYARVAQGGVVTTEAISVFNPYFYGLAAAVPMQAQAAITVDHHRSALPWTRTALAPVAVAAVVAPAPVTLRSAQLPPAALPAEPAAAARPKLIEPSTAADFSELMSREMPKAVTGMTLERAVEAINTTPTLRYYFQELSAAELAALGLGRQMYWVLVAKGREAEKADLELLAGTLAAARARARLVACETKLTKP